MPKNLNVAIIGSLEVYKSLAKISTESDISLGNHFSQDGIFTYVYPKGYPDKLSPLIQSIAIADAVVFVVGNIDASLGEQIVALSQFPEKRGMIVGKEIVADFIKSIELERWPDVPKEKIREELIKLSEVSVSGPSKVVLDHFFPVKGVGTVALGIVQRGRITAHQKIIVEPIGKEIEIRSIQMQDKDVQEAPCPARVGLALKGIEPQEMSRGFYLAEGGSLQTGKDFNVDFEKSKFFKSEIREGEVFQCFFGLQMVPGRVKSLQPFVIETEKLVAFENGERLIITKPDVKGLRIVGSGKIN
jgi:selenocysteine-specific translation elongation factor